MASKRIEFLNSLVNNNIVYDMCCDHGKIGELSLKQNKEVIFVDIVPTITTELKSRLGTTSYSKFEIITDSILNIDMFKDDSTIILAGIGSKLLSDFLNQYSKSLNETHQIIISGHSNQHLTIEAMNSNKLTRVSDNIIEDSSRYYEIYDCKKDPSFIQNLNINKMFHTIKGSSYYKEQLRFLGFKKGHDVAHRLYQQLLEI